MDTLFSLIDSIIEAAKGQSTIEWLALIFSIIYVILAAKENIWCWFFGLLGTFCSLLVYFNVQLYSDMTLQVFYIFMSIFGFWSWRKNQTTSLSENVLDAETKKSEELKISELPLQMHGRILLLGTLLAFILGYLWSLAGAALPYIDAFTTSFSIIATFMVVRKILENWLYWIVIDFVCIFVYINREIYLFSLLFFIYCVIAVFGYFNWRKQMISY